MVSNQDPSGGYSPHPNNVYWDESQKLCRCWKQKVPVLTEGSQLCFFSVLGSCLLFNFSRTSCRASICGGQRQSSHHSGPPQGSTNQNTVRNEHKQQLWQNYCLTSSFSSGVLKMSSCVCSSQQPTTTSSQQEALRSNILLLTITLQDRDEMRKDRRGTNGTWTAGRRVWPSRGARFKCERLWRRSDAVYSEVMRQRDERPLRSARTKTSAPLTGSWTLKFVLIKCKLFSSSTPWCLEHVHRPSLDRKGIFVPLYFMVKYFIYDDHIWSGFCTVISVHWWCHH